MASDIMSQDAPPPLPSRNPPRKVSQEQPHRPLPEVPNYATLPNMKNSSQVQLSTDSLPRRSSRQMSLDSSSSNYTNITSRFGSSTSQSFDAPPPLPQRNNVIRSPSSAEKSFRHPQASPVATNQPHLVPDSNVRVAPPPPSLSTLPRRKDYDEMETRFRFHSVEDFPNPEPMKEAAKTYPSHKFSKDNKSRRSPRQPLPAL
ncbi:hypothetical protein ACJMK2_039805 [Sinanodonta woodiana]|uniref:Uncharacterized protein n=1 Tax=Sinanodonta woodiana TaxID=1069815 RepID=A0ABD3WF40_SINWO